MEKGLAIAVFITLLWIPVEILFTKIKRPKNFFKAIIIGYFVSFPFVGILYFFIFSPFNIYKDWQGLLHAYIAHFIFFLLYFEIFKHLARSITLSFLVRLLESPNYKADVFEMQRHYSLEELIQKRLKFLEENGYIVKNEEGYYRITHKGAKFNRFSLFFIRLFRSKTQKERN